MALPEVAPIDPASVDHIYTKESGAEARWPEEVGKMDRMFVGALGAVGVLGIVGHEAKQSVVDSFHRFGTGFRELKNIVSGSIKNPVAERAKKSFESQLADRSDLISELTSGARDAKNSGDFDTLARNVNQASVSINEISYSRGMHWASKLGLAPSMDSLRDQATNKVHLELAKVPRTAAAREAKSRGDWTAYNNELETIAQTAERLKDNGATDKEVQDFIATVDRQLESVRANKTSVETLARKDFIDAKVEAQKFERQNRIEAKHSRLKSLVDVDHVLDLKATIDDAVAKAKSEATLLGNQTQLGFNEAALRAELTEKYMGKYFGTARPELNPSDAALAKAQAKVRSMLVMDNKQLENLRKK